MKINILYRISDAGNPKKRLAVATKFYCLDNCLQQFTDHVSVFADNCSANTIRDIESKGYVPIQTSLGNSGSWRFIVEYAIQNFTDDSYVYLVEDDYLHLPGSLEALKQGLQIADYVTLYDNPDKYVNYKDGGPNPYVANGGETGRVLLTKDFHWKETNSTTMSFATTIKVLKEDKKLWWYFTEARNPYDFFAFQILTCKKLLLMGRSYRSLLPLLRLKLQAKKRTLISPIPGLSTHAEIPWITPLTYWHNIRSWESNTNPD